MKVRATTIVLLAILVVAAGGAFYWFSMLKPEEAEQAIRESAGNIGDAFSVSIGEISSSLSEADAPVTITFGAQDWQPANLGTHVKFRKSGSRWSVEQLEWNGRQFGSTNELLVQEMAAYKVAYAAFKAKQAAEEAARAAAQAAQEMARKAQEGLQQFASDAKKAWDNLWKK